MEENKLVNRMFDKKICPQSFGHSLPRERRAQWRRPAASASAAAAAVAVAAAAAAGRRCGSSSKGTSGRSWTLRWYDDRARNWARCQCGASPSRSPVCFGHRHAQNEVCAPPPRMSRAALCSHSLSTKPAGHPEAGLTASIGPRPSRHLEAAGGRHCDRPDDNPTDGSWGRPQGPAAVPHILPLAFWSQPLAQLLDAEPVISSPRV